MNSIKQNFQPPHPWLETVAPGASERKRPLNMHRLHKWGGLVAALWIFVLGITGFLIDHRGEWRWLWQVTVPEYLVSQKVLEKSTDSAIQLYRIDPSTSDVRLAGGRRGLWRSSDAGANWVETYFIGLDGSPQILSIVEDAVYGWGKLWLATDDGVWLSSDKGATATRVALEGSLITALTEGSSADELVGCVSRTKVFRLNLSDTSEPVWIFFSGLTEDQLPDSFGLSRFVRDLHYGRGLFTGISSLLINDAGGIGMMALSLTGFLFWWMPKKWKKEIGTQTRKTHLTKKSTMRLLFHSHSTVFGIVTVIPFVYLAITGILIDHNDVLGDWMKKVNVGREWLPPVYEMRSWDDEIYSVAGYPGESEKLSLGGRAGLFTTADSGRTWIREDLPGQPAVFVWTLRRIGDGLYTGGMGSPNYMKLPGKKWEKAKGTGHMPSDMLVLPDGRIGWKGHGGIKARVNGDEYETIRMDMPILAGVPIFYFLDGLHSGVIFHEQWKWVNDLVSVIGLILVVTGLTRLWRHWKPSLKGYLNLARREPRAVMTAANEVAATKR
ncbi:MAG: PepSY domain-containing protein [Nitrospinota bacterium]|nr:PepSY domain-containing protein [Nitrospinota bacterium]